MLLNLSSAAVVIGVIRVNLTIYLMYLHIVTSSADPGQPIVRIPSVIQRDL